MSVLKKTPWIQAKLSTLSAENLSSLLALMNSDAQISYVYSLYDNARFIPALEEETDVVIQNCIIEFERGKHPYTGFLIHTSSMCIFIAYHRFQDLALFEIDNTNKTFVKINEECDIEELRRIVEGDAGLDNAWVDKMKQVMDYDSTDQEVEIGTRLYVDGKLEVGDTGGSAGDIVVGHEIIIDDLQKIVDTNGDSFIPDPSGHLNEALVHYTSGYTWKKGYELKGFQVVAKSVFESNDFTYQTHIVYFVWNDTVGDDHYGEVYVRYYEQ